MKQWDIAPRRNREKRAGEYGGKTFGGTVRLYWIDSYSTTYI